MSSLPPALKATHDPEADAFYFSAECTYPSVSQINLGSRKVVLDVDSYGRIIGVEVF